MNIAPGTFVRSGAVSTLPDVFVEKIQILPTNFETGKQRIDVTLSLQTVLHPSTLWKVPYMIFVGFSHDRKTIKKMVKNENLVKGLIRTPTRTIGHLVKRYVEPPKRGSKADRQWYRAISMKVIDKKLGTRLTKLSVTIQQEFNIEDLENLYIYATAYARDPQSISQSGVDRKIIAMKMSDPAVEVIMQKRQAPLTATAFMLEKDMEGYGKRGDVWGGPLHYSPGGGIMAGAEHKGEEHPTLIPKRVSNQKIQDLRFLNDIARLQFTASNNKSQVLSPRERKNLETARKVVSKPSKVSDCSYSRTKDNKLKIAFAIDYDRLSKENTRLGYFIRNPTTLAGCFQIENIRLYRTRVLPNIQPNELTPGKINICGSSASQSPEKLVGSLKDGTIQLVSFAGNTAGVRNFISTDEEMAHEHHGDFEYRVAIDMVDSSTTAAASVSAKLSKELAEYNKFLAAADSMGEKGFNIKERLKRDKEFLKGLNKEWESLINCYMTAVKFFFGATAFGELSSVAWRKNLIAMVNPSNGDILSMKRVSEIVSQFNTNLRMMFAPPSTPTSATAFSVRSRMGSQSNVQRKIQLNHVFRSNYTRRTSAATGTDYLDNTLVSPTATGYTSMAYDNYFERINNELKKYNVPRPNDPGINKFGFLSPARLFSGGSVVETSTAQLVQDVANGILNATLSPDPNSDAFVPGNGSDKVYNEEINSILGFSDIAMVPNTMPLADIVSSPEPISHVTIMSSFFLATGPLGTSFNKDSLDASTAVSGSSLNAMMVSQPRTMQIGRSAAASFFVNRRASGFMVMPPFIAPPSVQGSIAAEAAVQAPSNTELNSSFGNSVNFNSIVEVQYFDGYTVSNGIINLNAPVWRTMTKTVFEESREKYKRQQHEGPPVPPLLCRILLATKSLQMENLYALPEYDSLFILGAANTNSASENLTSWKSVYKAILKQMKVEEKNVAFDIGGPLASIDGSYIKSPAIIKHSHGPKYKEQQKSNETIINSGVGGSSRLGGGNY